MSSLAALMLMDQDQFPYVLLSVLAFLAMFVVGLMALVLWLHDHYVRYRAKKAAVLFVHPAPYTDLKPTRTKK